MIVETLVVACLRTSQPAAVEAEVEAEVEADADAQASADPITIIRTDGQTTPQAFEESLRRGLGDGFTPQCTVEPCDPATAPRLRVSFAERERDYDVVVSVTHGDGRTAEAAVACTICTPDEAGQKVAGKALELLASPIDGPAWLAVTSSPSRATVEVDGKARGQTPVRIEIEPGVHTVVVRKAGHLAEQRRVDLDAGGEDVLRIELPADRSRQQRTQRIAGWSLIGVGIAGVVTGIALVATDEKPVKNNCDGIHVDRFGNCEFRWNTLGAGIGILVPGIIATAAGATLVTIGRRGSSRGTRARLEIGPGRLSIAGRF